MSRGGPNRPRVGAVPMFRSPMSPGTDGNRHRNIGRQDPRRASTSGESAGKPPGGGGRWDSIGTLRLRAQWWPGHGPKRRTGARAAPLSGTPPAPHRGRATKRCAPERTPPCPGTWDSNSESRHQESPWTPCAQTDPRAGRCSPAAVEHRPHRSHARQAEQSAACRSQVRLGNIRLPPTRIGGGAPIPSFSPRPTANRVARDKPPWRPLRPPNTRRIPCAHSPHSGTCDNGTASICADNPRPRATHPLYSHPAMR